MKHELRYIKPSDAKSWLHCSRRVWLENFPLEGLEEIEINPFDQLIMEMGIRHEWGVKRELEKQYQVVEAVSPEHTKALMDAGVQIIYQPKIIDQETGIVGEPDFLIRTETGEYQPADAKLSRSGDKDEIQIQLAVYRKLLRSTLPALVFHGNGKISEIGDEANKLADEFLQDMRSLLSQAKEPEARYGESKCKVCPYTGRCKPKFMAKQELTLLYGIDSRSAPHLEEQGIDTIAKLAAMQPEDISDVPYLKGIHNKYKAVLQAKAYLTGEMFQIKKPVIPEGTWVHFDIESNPLNDSGEDHVYLWGLLKPPYDHSGFEYVWTDSETQDRDGWVEFLSVIARLKEQYADLVLAHFSSYEVSNIRRYAKRYEMENDPTVVWLLGEDSPLFDLQKPVKESLVLPISSYGLKQICKHEDLVNFQWSDDDSGSQWSVVQFLKFQAELIKDRREQIKKDILAYNFDDVVATRKLEEWLRNL
ncbi:MAG: TM0106 family RecB-like putative nuclease [Alphaproteobacteria bacterium]